MKTSRTKTKLWVSLLIALGAIVLSVFLSYTTLYQTLELKLLDLNFAIRGPVSVEDSPIVIVAIDDESDVSTPHRWPWPRLYYAHVIENLEEAGAAVIGIDVILDQPDKYGHGSDDTLAVVLKKYDNIVLTGKILRIEHDFTNSTLLPPYEKFLTDNTTWGLVSVEADLDGFYRNYLVGQTHFDSLYPSFTAAALKIYKGLPKDTPVLEDADNYYLGNDTIPKIDESSMLINYVGPARSFIYYSFSQILDDMDFDLEFEYDIDAFDDPGDEEFGIPPGLLASGLLKNKIVLIGSTMKELHDNFPTPFLEYRTNEGVKAKAETPGVEIHANALHTILTQNYIKRLPEFYLYLIILIFAAIVIAITRYLPTLWSVALAILLTVAYFIFTVYQFIADGLMITFSTPFLVVIFIYVGETIYHFLMTQKEKKVIRGAFAHYVPEKIVQQIIANPDKLSLGGEERIVSVLFSDVASFTTISEELSPRNLVHLLNEYLTEMSEVIHKFNGVIDKFEGDAIMAEFGVPVAYPDHAKAACNSAIEMQEKLRNMRTHWIKEGKPALTARIGINTGEVIVGNMGSRHLFDYTVMGDHVNLGARLEGANKGYGSKIMISEFTHNELDDEFFTRPLDFIRVKGKTKPVEVFELLGNKQTPFKDTYLEMIENYRKGYLAYRRRDWDEAIQIFEKCKDLEPKDQPSKMYFERCVEFKYNSPSEDWDGVIELKEK